MLGLLHLAVARISRPIARLGAGFEALGGGNYAAHVAANGPREITALTDGFNRMISRLKILEDANRRLTGQMLAIQEEERAELARDLHDEMGPFLFAMRLDAEAIESEARKAGQGEIATRAQALGETVSHIQSHVRDILKQLRPDGLAQIGLKTAIANLSHLLAAPSWPHRHRARGGGGRFRRRNRCGDLPAGAGGTDQCRPPWRRASRRDQDQCRTRRHSGGSGR